MNTAIQIENLCFAYGEKTALTAINMDIPAHQVTALIGPSGCGKSTLLRCINRINDRIKGAKITGGSLKIHGIDVMRDDIDLLELRRLVGMVFQKYNPF
ncbi:MAG: ATP-binding cassette domain-containing protein, partial [Verrucomicrobia bacterium]|nr:ATP-binding cassette domain-containing protein [Verrucomicrobiota bacterium]